jgi:hypothetical protein
MTLDRDPLRVVAAEALKGSAGHPVEALSIVLSYAWEQLCLRRTTVQMVELLHSLDIDDLIPLLDGHPNEKARRQ